MSSDDNDRTAPAPAGADTDAMTRPTREADGGGPATQDAPAATLAELEDRWRRALADLDNLRKRYARELARERTTERDRVTAAWLPVIDNLDRALAHAGADPDAIIAGVRAVRDQALEVLERLGYTRQDDVGVPFDPARHEVVSVVPEPDAEPGTVVQVVRPGYGTTDQVLRPASVAVSRRE